MANQQRLDWVDTAKALSIILVVMMHSTFGVGAELGEIGFMHWIIAFATPFRMPEFFLISGLFLSQVIGRSWARYLDRRAVHYLYFYALWAVILILFKTAIGSGEPLTALSYLAWALVEPYGVLWFIYLLAAFSIAAKLLFEAKVPHWIAFAAAALLQMAPIASGSYLLDQFSEYAVYFYAGYAFAPLVFRTAEIAAARPVAAIAGLLLFALANGILVFSGGFEMTPDHVTMGLAALPGLHLLLALAGAFALCALAALLAQARGTAWLSWVGAHSIVIYLAFTLPMAVSREVLLRLGLVSDAGLLSLAVLLIAVVSPILLYFIIQRTGWGRFLFERPEWARLRTARPGDKDQAALSPQPSN